MTSADLDSGDDRDIERRRVWGEPHNIHVGSEAMGTRSCRWMDLRHF